MKGYRWIPRTKASDAELWFFCLICVWMNGWVNNGEADDMRRHRTHYDVTVMETCLLLRSIYWQTIDKPALGLCMGYIDTSVHKWGMLLLNHALMSTVKTETVYAISTCISNYISEKTIDWTQFIHAQTCDNVRQKYRVGWVGWVWGCRASCTSGDKFNQYWY